MRHRANAGLNKGEAHHALKSALRIGRQGEIRDRTSEAQHFRIAGLNLLTAIIFYWNSDQIGHGSEAKTCKPRHTGGVAQARLAARLGAHPPHRRIQMAKVMNRRAQAQVSPCWKRLSRDVHGQFSVHVGLKGPQRTATDPKKSLECHSALSRSRPDQARRGLGAGRDSGGVREPRCPIFYEYRIQ